MRLKITANYPIEEVKQLVKLASKGINHRNMTVFVKNSRHGFRGRAYYGTWWLNGKRHQNHCVVAIGKPSHFPIKNHSYQGLKTAPVFDLNDWKEALVHVTAHELYHQRQFIRRKRNSEVEADRWGLKRLIEYRNSL